MAVELKEWLLVSTTLDERYLGEIRMRYDAFNNLLMSEGGLPFLPTSNLGNNAAFYKWSLENKLESLAGGNHSKSYLRHFLGLLESEPEGRLWVVSICPGP